MFDSRKQKIASALQRVKQRKSALQRELELFYMFVFGVFFGVLSSLMAIFWDAIVRGQTNYPIWYVLTICTAFLATLSVLFFLFRGLRRERRDITVMEENLEEMLKH